MKSGPILLVGNSRGLLRARKASSAHALWPLPFSGYYAKAVIPVSVTILQNTPPEKSEC